MGGKIFDKLLGFLKPKKKFKGKATKKKVLPKDPGAVLIAETIEGEEKKKKKKGGFLALFGAGGLFAALLPILAVAIPALIFIGGLLSDLFRKEGAISFFKKGEIGKGIMTLLFGRDISKKGKKGKLLGLGKQALKWGGLGASIGFLAGGPLGALIGFFAGAAFGAIGGLVKMGIDSGFFKKVFGNIKQWGKEKLIEPIKKIVGKIFDWVKEFISASFSEKIVMIKEVFGNLWGWIKEKIIEPAKEVFGKAFEKIGGFLKEQWDKIVDIGAIVGKWIIEKVIEPVSDIFGKIKEKIIAYKDEKMLFIKNLFSTVFESIREFFYKTVDFFSALKLSIFRKGEWKDIGRIAGKRAEILGWAREQGIEKETITEVLKTDELRDAIREGSITDKELLTLIHEELKKLHQTTKEKPTGNTAIINNSSGDTQEPSSEAIDYFLHKTF